MSGEECGCAHCLLLRDAARATRAIDAANERTGRPTTGVLVIMWREDAGPALTANVDRANVREVLDLVLEAERRRDAEAQGQAH